MSDLTPPFQGLTGLAIGWAGWAGDGDGITGSGPPSRPGSSEPAFDARPATAAPSAQLIAAKVLLRFAQRSTEYEFLAAEGPSAPTPPIPRAYPCELVRSPAFPGIFLPEAPCKGRYGMGMTEEL